jgi:hypothetical protein
MFFTVPFIMVTAPLKTLPVESMRKAYSILFSPKIRVKFSSAPFQRIFDICCRSMRVSG